MCTKLALKVKRFRKKYTHQCSFTLGSMFVFSEPSHNPHRGRWLLQDLITSVVHNNSIQATDPVCDHTLKLSATAGTAA